jgi:flagellar motor protein MotB
MLKSRSIALAALALLAACSSPPPPPPAPIIPPAPPAPSIPGPSTMSEKTLLTLASDLAFASGSYTLTKAGKAKLNALLSTLQSGMGPADKLVVYGYTDNRPNIVSAKGRGDTHPVAPNDTAKGRAANRRIEVVVEQPAG